MNTARTFILAAVTSLVACGGGLDDPTFATGSSAIVSTGVGETLVTANPDQGTLSRVDVESGAVTEADVGVEPTRVARLGDRLVVTLRGEDAIALVNAETLAVEGRIATGAEPYGVVASEDGQRFWVAVSRSDRVDEYDAEGTLLRSFAVPQEPRWLTLHPNGDDLYVASFLGGGLHWVDLTDGAVTRVEIPTVTGFSTDGSGASVGLTPRIMGDPSISPDGRTLAVPTLHVENSSPEGDINAPNPSAAAYYAPPAGGRFNPAVMTTSVIGGGQPSDDDWSTGTVDVAHGSLGRLNSYPVSVTWAPGSDALYVALESSSSVVTMRPPTPRSYIPRSIRIPEAGAGEIALRPSASLAVRTSDGPRGVAFLGDEAYVFAYHEAQVEALDALDVAERLPKEPVVATGGFGVASPVAAPSDNGTSVLSEPLFSDFVLSEDELRGRQLFYSSLNTRMSMDGAGISCSTCHTEGRTDGLTWPLDDGGRQTPSLAGGIAATEPVTWTLEVPSAADEAMATSLGRMGGFGLGGNDAEAIEAFIQQVRAPRIDATSLDADAVLRGQALFAQVGCDSCHSGARFTDNASYAMFGEASVNTPPLDGISASAPYLHDGSAPTLRAVVERAMAGEMGEAFSLTSAEAADLVEYLRSL